MRTQIRSQGASFIANQGHANPLDLVERLAEQHPSETREARFERFRALIADDDRYQRAIDWYFFVNMETYISGSRRGQAPEQRAAALERRSATVGSIKRQVMALSLSFMMPNGKPLSECTGSECATVGGWIAKVGKKVGACVTVGSVFKTDAELLAFLK